LPLHLADLKRVRSVLLMWNDSFISYDVETSGFGSSARILEVAVVRFEAGEPVEEWVTLLSPDDLNWEDEKVVKALEVNHITKEACEGKPQFKDIAVTLLEKLKTPIWVAHGRDFDTRMLTQEFIKAGFIFGASPEMSICTMELSRYLQSHIAGHKLEDTAGRWNVVLEEKHRALQDAKACGLILQNMLRAGAIPSDDRAMKDLVSRAIGARAVRRA